MSARLPFILVVGITRQFEVLDQIAQVNLDKTRACSGHLDSFRPAKLFDKNVPTIETEETTNAETLQRVPMYDGAQPVGDPLDDNSEHDDAYRYHDAFRLARMTVLGWSPVTRAATP